ncbi:hypothetical protein EI555_007611, partial [Monodon monoceros]
TPGPRAGSSQTQPNWHLVSHAVLPWKASNAPRARGAFDVSRGLADSWHPQALSFQTPTYMEQGGFHENQPFIQDNCYSHGYKLEFKAENSKLPQCHKIATPIAGGPTGPLWSVLVVVDNYSFNYSNNNVSKATEDILHVINVTDSIYLWLGLCVSLIGIEIWNQGNLINVEQHTSQLCDSFSECKRMCYCHDGLAVYKRLNDKSISFILQWSLLTNRVIILEFCSCRKKHCIMNAYNTNTSAFSNCSYGGYFNLINHKGVCLMNTPASQNIIPLEQCGNKVVEGEEDCRDCGSECQCRRDLKPWADCAFGPCYHMSVNVTFLSGTMEVQGDALTNFYVQDGMPCGDSTYCYHKMYNSHNKQCQYIFDQKARSVPQAATKQLMCKEIVVANMAWKFNIQKMSSFNYFVNNSQSKITQRHNTDNTVNGTKCWETSYHFGRDTVDIGEVKDGTFHALGKICTRRSCVNYSTLNSANSRNVIREEYTTMKNIATVDTSVLLPTVTLQPMEKAQTVVPLQGAVSFPHY